MYPIFMLPHYHCLLDLDLTPVRLIFLQTNFNWIMELSSYAITRELTVFILFSIQEIIFQSYFIQPQA